MARARVLRSKMPSSSLSFRCSTDISVFLVAGRQRKGQSGRETQPTRVGEAEREAASRGTCLPLALPTAIAVCSFVSNLKVVEGLTRKATGVEIYLAGMLLLARFVTRKLKALPGLSPPVFFPSHSPAYRFIGHCRINAGDTLLFR